MHQVTNTWNNGLGGIVILHRLKNIKTKLLQLLLHVKVLALRNQLETLFNCRAVEPLGSASFVGTLLGNNPVGLRHPVRIYICKKF